MAMDDALVALGVFDGPVTTEQVRAAVDDLFGRSRTADRSTIRQALRKLEERGVVESLEGPMNPRNGQPLLLWRRRDA